MHIHGKLRTTLGLKPESFTLGGTVLFPNLRAARDFTKIYLKHKEEKKQPIPALRAEDAYAMALIDEIFHYIVELYQVDYSPKGGPTISATLLAKAEQRIGKTDLAVTLREFCRDFPPGPVYAEEQTVEEYLKTSVDGQSGQQRAGNELFLLWISNMNPAYRVGYELYDHRSLWDETPYPKFVEVTRKYYAGLPTFGPDSQTLVEMLRAPAIAHPDSLQKQLEFIRDRWGHILGDKFLRLLRGIDFLNEVNLFLMNMGKSWGKPVTKVMSFSGLEEYERFSPDRDWMPKVVMIAKSTLVWLDQLSKTYGREIRTLDGIPDEELDRLARYGFNGLWLIGLWERSGASKRIKNLCGNPDAVSSAYSLYDYDIAQSLGGWDGVVRLRQKCEARGIRLASDMVPNHTGMDSKWVHENPDRFIQMGHSPFPGYTFNGENLSTHPDIGIFLEDHYYNQSDAAVVFKRVDFPSGDTRFIYHGNDGTHMPWNDTAQLDFLNPETREAVIQTILHVARNFSIIRFDAAMTLAKKHIQRLWYPEAGRAGDIPSRAEFGLSPEDFHGRIPEEFWREVVDRAAKEAPDTLLLAEAFWMMEGYFVRTLGMHRVYNSAFMNMLKNEENGKYRQTIKNTLEFDKDILKRFVNFMNNPDEDTAVAQFGKGDKYFGVCTLMATMPGLPMFGHGQVEGFHEKYGMEYQRAYFNESPDLDLIARHEREVFPILKKRYLFADVANFYLYDFWTQDGWVNENVFAYSNATDLERALVVYNNSYDHTWGYVKDSAGYVEKLASGEKEFRRTNLAHALKLHNEDNYYLLLWEQRSNLWFIRRSTDIHTQGLFVDVPGYSCQVFMDIHEVEDNKFAHYRILHDQLQGQGVRNITQAIRDIILEPVYREFRAFYTPEHIEKFEKLLGITSGKAVKEIAWFVEKIGAFLKPLANYLSSPAVIVDSQKRYERALKNLVALRALVNEPSLATEKSYVTDRIVATDNSAALFSAFMILHALGDQDEEWYLEEKIQEISGQPVSLNGLFKWMESYSSWGSDGSDPLVLSHALDVYSVVESLGTNYYDGVMWFRKESMENFAWWSAFYHLVASAKVEAGLVKKVVARSMKWLDYMDESGYRLDTLQELVESLVPKKASTPRKVLAQPKPLTKTQTKPATKPATKAKPQPKKKKSE